MAYPKLTPIIAAGATEPRYLADRFSDIVNVLDFGAVCDGIADDTTAFQAAATAASGKRIFIPQGSVNLSESVSGSFYSDGEIDFTGHPIAVNIVTKDLSLKDNPSFGALYSFSDSDESYGFLAQGVVRSGKYLFVPTGQNGHGLSRLYKIDTETGTRTYASLAEDKHFGSITIYNDKVYIVDNSSPSNIYIYDLSLTLESTINLDFALACIAYDEKRDCFWLLKSDSQGFSLYQYTTELVATGYHFVIPNSGSDSSVYAVVQDFCVYDGYFYFARSNQDFLCNIIFVTDVDGSIKKTYFLDESFGELEGICITSDYSADIACNGSNNKNIAIYNAEIFNNGFNLKPVTPFRNIGGLRAVSNHKPLSYIYADASFSGAYSDGSSARPFKSIVEAFNYIVVRNIKYQTGVVLNLKGDFSAEEAITVYGFNGSLLVVGDSTSTTKVNSLNFEACDYVQLSNIDFKATAPLSAGTALNIQNTPVVDIRGLSFTPSTKLSNACFNAMRCMVYFVSACSFSNAVNGIRLYQATANIGADHTFTSCDTNTIIFHSLVYGTSARLSGVTSSGSTSVKLTTA